MPKSKTRKKNKPSVARQAAARQPADPSAEEKRDAIRAYIAEKPAKDMAELIAFNFAQRNGDFETFVFSMLKERPDRTTIIGISVPLQKWGAPAAFPGFMIDGIPFAGLSLIGALAFHCEFEILDSLLKTCDVRYDDVLAAAGPDGAVLECSVFEHVLWVSSVTTVGAKGDEEAEAEAAEAMARLEKLMFENRGQISDVPTKSPVFRSSAGDLLAAAKAAGNDLAYAALNRLRAAGEAGQLDAHINEAAAVNKDRWI